MIDTRNEFGVGVAGPNDDIIILRRMSGSMTKPQAVRLAAWLVALADFGNEYTFAEVREAVENT